MSPHRISLIQLPTPLHRLERESARLGLDLWIKRDDLTGFAMGGNKGRKLEFLMAEATFQQADAVVTCGALQSNFIRQLAAACAVLGMECHAAVMPLPYEINPDQDTAQYTLFEQSGNVSVGEMVGVTFYPYPNGSWGELYAHAEALAIRLEATGKRVYRIPIGGSSPLGAWSFYLAAQEIVDQSGNFDFIITATSSGSTQTGLSQWFHGSPTKVIGIACDPEPGLVDEFSELSTGLCQLLENLRPLTASDFNLNLEFVGPGYGLVSDAGNLAILQLANSEGIFLDPIYSGKAYAGLLDLVRRGEVHGRVLFWHTGGVPTLFSMPAGYRWSRL